MMKHCIIKWLKVEMSYRLNSNIWLQWSLSGQSSVLVMNKLSFSRLVLPLSIIYFWTSQQAPWSRIPEMMTAAQLIKKCPVFHRISQLTSLRFTKYFTIYVSQHRNIICKCFTSDMLKLALSQAYLGGWYVNIQISK